MARGRQLRSRLAEPTAEVNDWVDDQQRSSTFENLKENPNIGFVSNLFQACLHTFIELSKYCRKAGCDRALQIRVHDDLANIVLWGDACEDGKLDTCLKKSEELYDSVVEALHGIGQTLNQGVYNTARIHHNEASQPFISAQGDLAGLLEKAGSMLNLHVDNRQFGLHSEALESEAEENSPLGLESRMRNYVNCLMDLTPTLQQVMDENDVSLEDPRNASDMMTFHVSQPARQYVLRIVDKYKTAPRSLVERLGEANWQRYVRIQRQIQGTREAEGEDDGEIGQIAKSTFVPLSKFHDSGIGSSKPARSAYAASNASHTSFASTESDAPTSRLRVPPTPLEVAEGLSFACYICGDVLTDVRNRIDWKMHIFRDLEPYICKFGGCNESLIVFPTRKLWFEHELTKHRAKSLLECHECLRRFDTESDFLVHHEMDHSRHFSKLHLQANLSSARNYLPLVPEELQCPLCLQSQWLSQRKFVTHLGRHMEDIALASFPRDAASASEADSDPESDVDSQKSERPGDSYPFVPSLRKTSPTISHLRGKRISNLILESPVLEQAEETLGSSVEDEDIPRARRTRRLVHRTPEVEEVGLQRSIDHSTRSPERLRISKSSKDQGKATPNARRKPTRSEPIKSTNNTPTRSLTQSEHIKTDRNTQRRVFACPFSHYGCEATFGSNNEWKRHTSMQHLQLGFYRCDTGLCNPDRQPSSTKSLLPAANTYNDFNRKDLFTQHHRRMHTPWNMSQQPSAEMKLDFENSLERVRERCWHMLRVPPQRSTCGFCGRVFEGPNGWDERMEHVGKHFEGKNNGVADVEGMREEEDDDLRKWAIKEGIVKDCGSRGFWLEGMEPLDVPGSKDGSRRRRLRQGKNHGRRGGE